MKKHITVVALTLSLFLAANAQEETTKGLIWSKSKGLEYSIKAGFNIGGTSPLPLPAEIRSIESYRPILNLAIEGSVTKWFTDKWGIETGIRLETKGMKTKAEVKNYGMELVETDGHIKGRWTGLVSTKVNNTYFTVPVLAAYKLSTRWKLNGGLFFSYMSEGDFSGNVYDGYIRDIDPTGVKMYIDEASYDFSDNLSRFQWGAQVGADWRAFKHLTVSANLTWGFKDIFKKSFDTITFDLYPIYLNVGFGYAF